MTSCTITGLEPGTQYTITVQKFTIKTSSFRNFRSAVIYADQTLIYGSPFIKYDIFTGKINITLQL